ncbi:30S ribosomal protein S8 [bacterium]
MASTDPIADLLTCIRNANMKFHEKLDVPASKVKEAVLNIMKQEGYITNFKRIDDGKHGILRIYMKYTGTKNRVIRGLRRVSRPGLRKYVTQDKLPKVRRGIGIALISTSRGIMTCKQAGEQRIGGEVFCYIW